MWLKTVIAERKMKENILQNIEFQGNKQLWIIEEIYHEIALLCEDIK